MDYSMALGLLGALLVFGSAAGEIRAFFDLASFAIVLGGSLSVLLTRTPWQELRRAFMAARAAFVGRQRSHQRLTEELLALAELARREGVVALEREPVSDPLLAKGLRLLADGMEMADLEKALRLEQARLRLERESQQNVFLFWAEVAPAMGLIGTVIGLVRILSSMSDPRAIGSGMAVALLTTLYGALLANIVCMPMAQKIGERASHAALDDELMLQAVLLIKRGGHPLELEGLIAPAMRAEPAIESAGAAEAQQP